MDNDDEQIGHVLSRREILALFGKAGFGIFAGYSLFNPSASLAQTGTNSCVVKPAMTIGPYFKDEKLNRSDIRTDPSDGSVKLGVPLELKFNVSRVGSDSCAPLEGALVDVWHCDALGSYSDFAQENTLGKKFLRGYQATDGDGLAQFTILYPGWYQGRAVHIHFRIRTSAGSYRGSDFVSQLFFDETLTDKVHSANAPYSSKGLNRTRNSQDGIFRSGGSQMLLSLAENPQIGGYTATFDIGVQVECGDLEKGDANGDGAINTGDATTALRTAVGLETPNDCLQTAADMNGDGWVRVNDATAILKKIIGL